MLAALEEVSCLLLLPLLLSLPLSLPCLLSFFLNIIIPLTGSNNGSVIPGFIQTPSAFSCAAANPRHPQSVLTQWFGASGWKTYTLPLNVHLIGLNTLKQPAVFCLNSQWAPKSLSFQLLVICACAPSPHTSHGQNVTQDRVESREWAHSFIQQTIIERMLHKRQKCGVTQGPCLLGVHPLAARERHTKKIQLTLEQRRE